jgi:uncharacterized membrane protein YphA (DoxX/SURF4 family)
MIKKIILVLLSVLMGAVFLLSGYTKIYPIEPFEFTFVDIGIVGWQLTPFVARILIGLEFLIGILLVLNLNLKKIAYKLGIFTLVIFSIYLILLIAFSGNQGNCGCFGETIKMTPLQALIKNAVMLVVFYILNKYHEGWSFKGKWRGIALLVYVVALAYPFILNPVQLDYSESYLNKPEGNYYIPLDTLYNNARINIPPKTLSQGKQILVFASLTCPHCRTAAKKIHIINKKNPEIPFYFILNGDEITMKEFFEDTKTENIPHCMLGGRNFIYLAGTSLPRIYLINNSTVEHEVDYMELNQGEVERWLNLK